MSSPNTTYVVDLAKQSGNQLLSIYRQSARFGWDAAQAWAETAGQALRGGGPVSPAALVPGMFRETFSVWMTATLDLAENAVRIQRELLDSVLQTTG